MTSGITKTDNLIFMGKTPWHGLGTPINDSTSFDDAFKLANLDFTVKTKSVYDIGLGSDGKGCYTRLDDLGQISYRTDTGVLFNIVGPRWTPLQNHDVFELFRPLIDDGSMNIHTAGTLFGGKRIWVLCQINNQSEEVVKGDGIGKFVMISNSHDGTKAVYFGFTSIRIVCANTEAMATRSSNSKLVRIRHNKNVLSNVQSLRNSLDLANLEFQGTMELYRELASKGCSAKDMKRFLKIMFDVSEKADNEISTRTANAIREVERLYNGVGRGASISGVKGTWWGAYNSYSEYLNYTQGNNQSNRIDSLWFGKNSDLNAFALSTALEMAV